MSSVLDDLSASDLSASDLSAGDLSAGDPGAGDLSASSTRADALFASALQRSDQPSPGQVRLAIAAAVASYGDQGCAARVAQAFGEHPETAVTRMRWARMMVARDVPAIALAA